MDRIHAELHNLRIRLEARDLGNSVVYALELEIPNGSPDMGLFRWAGVAWVLYPNRSETPFPEMLFLAEEDAALEMNRLIKEEIGPYRNALRHPDREFKIVPVPVQ